MAEVARRAGVSITTVSRVLSPSGHKVSQQTQQRVRAAVRELGYSPSPLAQALAKGASRIVGVLVGDNDDPHFAGIIRGAEAVAEREGYLVIVCNTERRPEREARYVRLLGAYRAEGLLFIGGGVEGEGTEEALAALREEVARFRAQGGAVVATTQHRLDVIRVAVDSAAGAALAAQHLVALGHRRIGLALGPPSVSVSRVRAAGFLGALKAQGRAAGRVPVEHGDLTRVGGEAAGGRLLALPAGRRPTAIFAANDLMAIGVLHAARARGLQVPADLSVVGLGDIPLADSVCPPLTTVHFPLRELGEAAMEALLEGRRGTAPATTLFAPRLVVRESTAPPGRTRR